MKRWLRDIAFTSVFLCRAEHVEELELDLELLQQRTVLSHAGVVSSRKVIVSASRFVFVSTWLEGLRSIGIC